MSIMVARTLIIESRTMHFNTITCKYKYLRMNKQIFFN